MTDIVERLRELPDCHNLHGRVFRAVREAADEIERLRKALLALTLHEEAAAKREGLEPCHEAQEARWLLNGGKYD